MNKTEFIEKLSERADTTKSGARESLNEILDIIQDVLSDGDDVMFTGFGKFENRPRQSTQGRNPQTGEKMKIPATIIPKFKAGKNLKEGVREELELEKDTNGELKIKS